MIQPKSNDKTILKKSKTFFLTILDYFPQNCEKKNFHNFFGFATVHILSMPPPTP